MINIRSEIVFEKENNFKLHLGLHTDQAIKSAAKRMGPNTKVWMLTEVSQDGKSWYTALAQDIVSGELIITGEKRQIDQQNIKYSRS